jgi:DNA ligase-1
MSDWNETCSQAPCNKPKATTFKPMLALSKLPDFSQLRFPLMVSPKLDGVRASMQGGRLLSRSLKPIPNTFVQGMFEGLPEGVDGELIHGEPFDDPYRRTVSVVMSDNKPAVDVKLYLFDRFGPLPFATRLAGVRALGLEDTHNVVLVPHFPVNNIGELEECERKFLSHGYEGLMIRDPQGPYKQGRSSEREGWLMKVKRWEDAEARIVDYYEEQENQNIAFTNELGRTARSTAKAGKVGKNRLGGFHCVGVGGRYDGIDFDVASGAMSHILREDLWQNRDLIGKLLVYKFFPKGGDIKPRHPIFKGFRDARDLS